MRPTEGGTGPQREGQAHRGHIRHILPPLPQTHTAPPPSDTYRPPSLRHIPPPTLLLRIFLPRRSYRRARASSCARATCSSTPSGASTPPPTAYSSAPPPSLPALTRRPSEENPSHASEVIRVIRVRSSESCAASGPPANAGGRGPAPGAAEVVCVSTREGLVQRRVQVAEEDRLGTCVAKRSEACCE